MRYIQRNRWLAVRAGDADVDVDYARMAGRGYAEGWRTAQEVESVRPEPWGTDEIRRLVADLGANEFVVRQRATQRLASLGPAAVADLAAARDSSDAEIRQRASYVLAMVQKQHTKRSSKNCAARTDGRTRSSRLANLCRRGRRWARCAGTVRHHLDPRVGSDRNRASPIRPWPTMS